MKSMARWAMSEGLSPFCKPISSPGDERPGVRPAGWSSRSDSDSRLRAGSNAADGRDFSRSNPVAEGGITLHLLGEALAVVGGVDQAVGVVHVQQRRDLVPHAVRETSPPPIAGG